MTNLQTKWHVDLEGMPHFDKAMERVYAWYEQEIIDPAIPGGLLLEVDSHFRYCIFAVHHSNFRKKASDIFPITHIWHNYACYPCIWGRQLRELLFISLSFL